MALHHYGEVTGQQTNVFRLFLEWSRKDNVSYQNDEDVEAHWISFSNKQAQSQSLITVKTLIKLASMLALQYPKPIWKDGKPTKYPEINEYENFEYLLKHFNIKLYSDYGGQYFISGNTDILERFFTFPSLALPHLDRFWGPFSVDMLISATTQLCQAHNWKKLQDTTKLVKLWRPKALFFDLFTEWLNTPYDQLPKRYTQTLTTKGYIDTTQYAEQSTVDYIYDCMNVQYQNKETQEEEKALYYACLEKTLLHIIKYRSKRIQDSYRNDSGGMLILVGPEHTYKSTFCKMLLPKALDIVRKEANQKIDNVKAERDFVRYLGSKAIVQVDEFEGLMNMKTNSSFLKNILTSDNMSQTEIYASTETALQRKAIIIATTNEVKHVLSKDGSRRLWFIPTGTLDTDKLEKFNHHAFYNSLKKKFNEALKQGKQIWQLTKEQAAIRTAWNEGRAAVSSLALVLEEIWAFTTTTMPDDYLDKVVIDRADKRGTRCLSTLNVASIVKEYMPNVDRAHLVRELQRYCAEWTETTKVDRPIGKTSRLIKGKLCQHWLPKNRRYQYEYWVMPPRIAQLSSELTNEMDENSNKDED